MQRFTLPRDLYYGDHAMDALKTLRGHKRAMVVTGGSSMQKFGFLDQVIGRLSEVGIQVELFAGVEPDPSVETVMRGAKAMQAFEPDVIVAIGGGSPIDAAKAMWVFYEYPDKTFEDIKEPFTMPKLRQKALFVAIPSTSGTATEVTAFSVITDYSTKIKYPLADFEITPDIAILDPDIAQTMPASLVADTGMDALTHAIEAATASLRSAFSDPLALKAISMIFDDLADSYHGDTRARGRMHIAQCLAGMAFSNALLGITHSLAHKMGAQFGISHGRCNAVLLPYVIAYNAREPQALAVYADIARELRLPGQSETQLMHALIHEIRRLSQAVQIPHTLVDCGVTQETFDNHAKDIAHFAQLDPCTGSNPRKSTEADLYRLLTCAYCGTPVAF